MAKRPAIDPVTAYARDVVAGRVVAGKPVRQACERHLRDLKEGPARGLRWDPAAAQVVFDFFRLLQHSKGRWAGRPFELQPWQQFVVGSLFGWKRADGTRRFRTGHVEVARKNGKSTLAAGVGLALFLLDGEPGAEVYTAATKRDQAKITHEESKRMVKASPSIRKRVSVFKDNLSVPATNSKYEPLTSEGDSLDGLNVSGAIMDELHAWKLRLLWDVLETATGARDQPLFLITTTAGFDKHSIWWERRELALKVLDGIFDDDSLFAYIATLDEGDDWTDERVWAKGNPGLGVTVKVEELREKCEQARQVPGKQNAFRRLRLNVPTEVSQRWIDMELWDACAGRVDEEELAGRECWAGLDLGRVSDLSALALLFPPDADDPYWYLLLRFWCPEDDVKERSRQDRVPYDLWVSQGLIRTTPGNTTDYGFVQRDVVADAGRFRIREIAFDRTFAGEIIQGLQDEGLDMVAFGQGFLSMAAPTAEFERLLKAAVLRHGGNPVLRWMASNVAVRQDPAGNLKPDKEKSAEKIDGIVAAIMAVGRAVLREEEGNPTVEWI